MPSNREISKLFTLYAELLLLHNKDERLAELLSGAAYRLRNIRERVASSPKEALSNHFKTEIINIIFELKNTGTIEAVDELIQLTPQGLFEMMRIKGLGGKKLSVLWKTAKIDSVDALLEACKKNKVSKIPGFGLKTQQNIINAIEAYHSSRDDFHYASVADGAKALVGALQSILKTELISLCGAIRRQTLTIKCIEIIAALPAKNFIDRALRKFIIIQSSSQKQTKAYTLDEIPITIYHTSKDNFYYELFLRTGNIKHVKKLLRKITIKEIYASEEAIYKKAGLPYIVPEMREDVAEWNF